MIENNIEALDWLKRRARHIQMGDNPYKEVRFLFASLLVERAAHTQEIAELKAEIARLQTPPEKLSEPFGTEVDNTFEQMLTPRPIEIKKCICRGFYKPLHCPLHGNKKIDISK